MRYYFFSLLYIFSSILILKDPEPSGIISPLAEYSSEWNDTRYLKCNTAANSRYMTEDEREVIYLLNLLHANPVLFANTVVEKYPDRTNQPYLRNMDEYKSLLDTLRKMKPVALAYPDSLCFASAQCHAITSGHNGYVGHQRKTKECKNKFRYYGECCDYGHKKPLTILMSLLIDENVPSLGHRYMCLSPYGKIGVSIQPHKGYSYNAVLDFYY